MLHMNNLDTKVVYRRHYVFVTTELVNVRCNIARLLDIENMNYEGMFQFVMHQSNKINNFLCMILLFGQLYFRTERQQVYILYVRRRLKSIVLQNSEVSYQIKTFYNKFLGVKTHCFKNQIEKDVQHYQIIIQHIKLLYPIIYLLGFSP